MFNFNKFINLRESYASQKALYLKQGADPAEVDEYLKSHKFLKDRKDKVLTQEVPNFNAVDIKNRGNIDFFKNFADLKNFILAAEKVSPIKNKMAAQNKAAADAPYIAAKQRFLKDGRTADEVDKIIMAFRRLLANDKGLLTGEMNNVSVPAEKRTDINAYTNFDDLEKVVDEALAASGGARGYDVEFKEAKVIYDDDKIAIYRALNPQGCIEIKGSHPTSWCVARTDLNSNMYYNYRGKNHKPTFYFVKNKEKFAAEGDDVKHQQYKDRYHFFVVEVHEPYPDGKQHYTVVSAYNGDDTEMSWDDIVKIDPLLADKKSLFVWHPYTDEEDVTMRLGNMTAEEFAELSYEKKAMAVNVTKNLPFEKFKSLPEDLQKLYISTNKPIDGESLDLIRKSKDNYFYLVNRQISSGNKGILNLNKEFINYYKDSPVLQKFLQSGEIIDMIKNDFEGIYRTVQYQPENFLQFFVDNYSKIEPKLDQKLVRDFALALMYTKSGGGGGAPEVVDWAVQQPAMMNFLRKDPSSILSILENTKNPDAIAAMLTEDELNNAFQNGGFQRRLHSRIPEAQQAFDRLMLKHIGDRANILKHGTLSPDFLQQFIASGKNLEPWDALSYLSLIKRQYGDLGNITSQQLLKILQDNQSIQILKPALAKLTDENVIATMKHHNAGYLLDPLSELERNLQKSKLSIFKNKLDANTLKDALIGNKIADRSMLDDMFESEKETLRQKIDNSKLNEMCHHLKLTANILLKFGSSLSPVFRHNLNQLSLVCGINSGEGLGQSMGIKTNLDQPYRPSWGIRKESLSSFKVFLEFIESI